MKHKSICFIVVLSMSILLFTACRSDSDDVATLRTTENTQAEVPKADDTDDTLDNEAMMMAWTECLRDHGIDVMDPVVDTDGNVDKPALVEGAQWDKETMGPAWDACAVHLEGFTFEKRRVDMSEVVDQYMALTTCLREKGYDVDDPTAETFGQWGTDFRVEFDWDDTKAMADYQECSSAE